MRSAAAAGVVFAMASKRSIDCARRALSATRVPSRELRTILVETPPGQTAYAAAKFAVRGFSESLRHELQMAASPVRLSVVHPGGVSTNIVRNSRDGTGVTDNARRVQSIERFDAIAKTTPAAAALRIIKGIEHNQPRILIGNDARFMDLLQRLRPGTYWAVLARRIEKMAKAGK